MNVRFGLACLSLLISCWCCTTSSVSVASNGVRPRRQSRRATLNEYLTPPAPPNVHASRGPGFSRHPRNYQHRGAPKPQQGSQGSAPPSPLFRRGKIMNSPPTETPGYFARLMGWLNPFGGSPNQGSSTTQQQLPENIHQENFKSGHPQPLPVPNEYGVPAPSYGSPAPSYGPPTNSFPGHVSGETFPHPPSPHSGQAYLPPQKTRNCNPCNQVPWIPLYNGINTEDARHVADSTNVALSESLDSTLSHQWDNGGTNVHPVSSFSHEVKMPDFGYGSLPSFHALDPNHQASSLSAQLSNNNNNNINHQNLNYAQVDNRSPFTSPIPNPQLYPGAMPPLYKAVPFGSKRQGTDTSFDPPPVFSVDSHQPNTSFSGGGIDDGDIGGGVSSEGSSFAESLDLHASFPGAQSYQSDKQSTQNGVFNTLIDHQYEQQQIQNVESSAPFDPTVHHQQSSSHDSKASLDEGYVDELPPGAETVPSGPDDHFPSTSFDERHANDNGAANSDYRHTLHSSADHFTKTSTSLKSSDAEQSTSVGQKDFHGIETNRGNIQQSTSYGSQVSTDGQHVIHYEQSPVIDLSSIGGDERRKNSNDSSASSSTSTGTVEDPPVILQNSDGTYGINATWPVEESPKIVWPKDDDIGINFTTVTASTLPKELSSESSASVKFDTFVASSTDIPVTPSSPENNRRNFTGYSEQLARNDSVHRAQHYHDSRNENRTGQENYDSTQSANPQGSQQELEEQLKIPEIPRKQSQAPFSPYHGLIRFEDTESYGFRLPDLRAGSANEEPFLKALMKSYPKFEKDPGQNSDRMTRPVNRETWFDPRQIHPGAGFKPSRDYSQRLQSVGDGKSRLENRPPGTKKNKQVQIIIPYTSQYTPEPFHPLREDWSTKTTSPVQTQARKVPIYETTRDYLTQETQRVENEVSQLLQSLKNSPRVKEITRTPNGAQANTSIDVLRLQKNIDNWTIQEYSRATTASTAVPKFSRPYLSPSKKIPNEYLTTTEPSVPLTKSIVDTRRQNDNVLAGFSFNDLEHEGSASDQIDISHVQISSHINEVSSVFPEIVEKTTATSIVTPKIERDSWKRLPVSISPLNKERVYVVTPQSITTLPTTRAKKSHDEQPRNETTMISKNEPDLDHFESIERAYQVLPQAVNNLVVASTGPATVPLWGIMEHDKYASIFNNTTPESPILYAGHSKVSHTRH